eukprot:INCI14335.4.p1 GENE.INCI14335.4~~INCI14335.4.p1  ORF type:complete len:1393 (+),score=208.86 INCI14335.4:583-4761(+)
MTSNAAHDRALNNNLLTGTLPPSLCSWKRVSQFVLNTNKFSGQLPSCIKHLTGSASFQVSHNNLTGTVPAILGSFYSSGSSGLIAIALDDNQFTGTIPPSLRHTPPNRLNLSANALTGTLPAGLYAYTVLIHDNKLTSTIPSTWQYTGVMKYLNLARNELTGEIPKHLASFTNLVDLDLSGNALSGMLWPSVCGMLTQLEDGKCNLTGMNVLCPLSCQADAVKHCFEPGWAQRIWPVRNNTLSDEFIPSCVALTLFNTLASTHLQGTLPSWLGSLSKLTDFSIQDNDLTGSIPAFVGSLRSLRTLNLADNHLTGALPRSLSSLSSLTSLNLTGNALLGTIPARLCPVFQAAAANGQCHLFSYDSTFYCPLPQSCSEVLIDDCGINCIDPPIDCEGAWQSWTSCAASCGVSAGVRTRTFEVETAAAFSGRDCSHSSGELDTVPCDTAACPVDCSGAWSAWSACSLSCDTNATQTRTFNVAVEAASGGVPCDWPVGETEALACNSAACPVDCDGAWQPWGACSGSCGSTTPNPTRTFVVFSQSKAGGADCIVAMGATEARSDEFCNQDPCPIDCEGAWTPWSTCAVSCGGSNNTVSSRSFEVDVVAAHGGQACAWSNAEVQSLLCGTEDCPAPDAATTSETALPVWTLGVIGALAGVVFIGIIAFVAFFVSRKKKLQVHGSHDSRTGYLHKAVAISVPDDPEAVLDAVSTLLDTGCSGNWNRIRELAELVRAYRLEITEPGTDSAVHPRLARADAVLRESLGENRLLFDSAVSFQNIADAARYEERMKLLASALSASGSDSALPGHSTENSPLECVVPDLLLHKDRFSGASDAFLGRGASGVVSSGILVEVIGVGEVRTKVAVKEIQKTGEATELQVMREYLVLKKKLQPAHPNVINVLSVKSSSSTFYVIMEFCNFSLANQPASFEEFLHGRGNAAPSKVAQIVLNALVQDILRAVGFLHSKSVFHCDIKPANILVRFSRSGHARQFKPKYFKEAIIKVADFGVSRIIRPESTGGSATTATVSLAAFDGLEGIAGTEAFMAPEMLRVLRRLKAGDADAVQEVTAQLLTANDSFGCGCVIAHLCTRGVHPFYSPLFVNVVDNIVEGRRAVLHQLGFVDERHMQLVDSFTQPDPGQRWTVQQALQSSVVFESTWSHDVQPGTILLDTITLHERPLGTCRDQLLAPDLAAAHPSVPTSLADVPNSLDDTVKRLQAIEDQLPRKLDVDSYYAIAGYTYDDGIDAEGNIYHALNTALRTRDHDRDSFRRWQGFLYFLMRALDQLNPFEGTVYRGSNFKTGTDIETLYSPGRPIQWAAFTSTSTDVATARQFVDKKAGIIFKISVFSGRVVSPYSHIPRENEVLLTPNTRFTVTRSLYRDHLGFSFIDLVETHGTVLSS